MIYDTLYPYDTCPRPYALHHVPMRYTLHAAPYATLCHRRSHTIHPTLLPVTLYPTPHTLYHILLYTLYHIPSPQLYDMPPPPPRPPVCDMPCLVRCPCVSRDRRLRSPQSLPPLPLSGPFPGIAYICPNTAEKLLALTITYPLNACTCEDVDNPNPNPHRNPYRSPYSPTPLPLS